MKINVHYLRPQDGGNIPMTIRRPNKSSDQPGGILGQPVESCMGVIACQPGRTLSEAMFATGDPGSVTCEHCLPIATDDGSAIAAQSMVRAVPLQPCKNC